MIAPGISAEELVERFSELDNLAGFHLVEPECEVCARRRGTALRRASDVLAVTPVVAFARRCDARAPDEGAGGVEKQGRLGGEV